MRLNDSSIVISGLRLRACHGVLPQEHVVGNDYVVDVCVHYDISRAMRSDDLSDTLNYAQLAEIIAHEMAIPAQLIESVAHRIGETLFSAFPEVTRVELEILKIAPPMEADCRGAGVKLDLMRD